MHVIGSLGSGGAEAFISDLCVKQSDFADVHLYTFWGAADEKGRSLLSNLEANDVKVYARYTPSKFAKYLSVIFVFLSLVRKIKEIEPDIVQANGFQAELLVGLACFFVRKRIPFVLRIGNTKRNTRLPKVLWWKLDSVWDLVIASGPAVARNYPFSANLQVVTIPSGVRLRNRCQRFPFDTLRRELKIEPNKVILLAVGSLGLRVGELQKGQDLLIEALGACQCKERINLIFLGDGTERSKLEHLAASNGLQDIVSFRGNVTNVDDFLLAADMLVMPSRFEGLSIASIEAACTGLPMLLSKIDEFLLFDRDSTIFCEPNSVVSLTEALNSCIDNLDSLKIAAHRNTKFYHDLFDITVVSQKYLGAYMRLTHNNVNIKKT